MTVKPYNTEHTKKEEVREMFDRIAPTYDLLNHSLSLNVDRLWRRHAVDAVRAVSPRRVVDVATGTGDLAIALARRIPAAEVTGIDLSAQMLAVARRKAEAAGLAGRIRLEEGDGERLPLPDASADAATVAFGIRNFGDPEAGLAELRRILKPGGRLVILEFSRPRNRVFRLLYEWYTYKILPWVGGLVSRDRRAYTYLPESVEAFLTPAEFLALMERVGFRACRARSQSFGIAQIYIGEK